MSRCPSCFRESADGSVCAECSARSRSELALPLGATLRNDRYQIGRTLGDPGGFGVTYLGWDASLERCVAIKEYFPRHIATRAPSKGVPQPLTITAGEDFTAGLKGFLDEARRLAKLDHPNIVKVHDYCEAHGTGYLVMSYYEGRDLSDYAKSRGGRLPWQEALSLALPLLDGLAEVHRAGLIHRDIKPANVYLATTTDGKGRPILIDFGAARWASTTHELTAILTEGFAPLEQYPNCGPQGPYTDLYATAATLYALIAGVVPASAPSRLAGGYVSHLTDLVAGVPRRLGDALDQALSVQFDDRPQTAGEFARLLRAAEPASSVRVGTSAPRDATRDATRDALRDTPRDAPSEAATAPMSRKGWTAVLTPDGAPAEEVPATRQNAALPPAPPSAAAAPSSAAAAQAMSAVSAAPGSGRTNRVPVMVGGLVLAAVVAWGAWSVAGPKGASQASPPPRPAADSAATSARKAAGAETPARSAASTDPATEVRTILASAEQAANNGRYAEAMRSLGRAHTLLADPRLTGDARTRGATRLDSLAMLVESACPTERAMQVRRGESPPACPSRSW